MNTAHAELLKEHVQSQHFTSTADIMVAMKEMFRDVIQTVTEVEVDEKLVRQRCRRLEDAEVLSQRLHQEGQLGDMDIKVPRECNESYESKIISKNDRNAEGMEDKILAL